MALDDRVSFVLATHDRRAVLESTLHEIHRCGLTEGEFEVFVVDNASPERLDDLPARWPAVRVIRLEHNAGSCAKSRAIPLLNGEFTVFLDDDSYPHPGSIERMIRHFEDQPDLGAAGFVATLTDGRRECSAFPNVFTGCGVGFRTECLRRLGGLDELFFMQAEEYDLSFRLINAGYEVRTFDDLFVTHLKSSCNRDTGRTTYYDIRNNLILAARHLPSPWYERYRKDWLLRYEWLAERNDNEEQFHHGANIGRWLARRERRRAEHEVLTPAAFETLFRHDFVLARMEQMHGDGVRGVALAGFGKNILAFYTAARRLGLTITGIADDRFAADGRTYRGVPLLRLDRMANDVADAVVISDTSAVGVEMTEQVVTTLTNLPIYTWFGWNIHESGTPSLETEAALV